MNALYRTRPQPWIFLLSILAFPSVAEAHVGTGPASQLWNGLLHPLGGPDHLLAMVGVGLWAAQRGGRAIWLVPLAFVSVMAVGNVLAVAAISLPFVEPAIIASVLILGILIAAAVRLPLAASALVVGLFALVHGHAHGTEMPLTASGFAYAIGFVLTTALLHLCGIAFGLAAREFSAARLVRYVGGAIAACGVLLLLSA